MLDIWEQREWHGISRRGPGKADPFGSRTELNTDPGEDELRKIPARSPYLSSRLPLPAAYFNDLPVYWGLYNSSGAAVSIPWAAATSWFYFSCIFQLPDLAEYYTDAHPTIFAAGHTPGAATWAWGLYLDWNAGTSVWELKAQVRRDTTHWVTVTSPVTLASGSWYHAICEVSKIAAAEKVELNVYTDGSLTPSGDTDTTATYDTFSGTYNVSVGGYGNPTHTFLHGAVAYASVSEDTIPSPWVAAMPKYSAGDATAAFFFIFDPKREAQPAKIGDATNGYQWLALPARTMRFATDTTIFNARGLNASAGRAYKVDLPGGPLFKQQTVFLFCFVIGSGEGADLLRTDDGSFNVRASSGAALTVTWTPNDPAKGSYAYGGRNVWAATSAFTVGTVTWLAVKVDPTNQDGQDNIFCYLYNAGTDAWDAISKTSGEEEGRGIISPNTNTCYLAKVYHDYCYLYDFRYIVGDASWNTKHIQTSITTTIPNGLSSWLCCDVTSRWPRQDNVITQSLPHRTGYGEQVLAVGDRIDGVPRYILDPQLPLPAYTGCPYISYGSMPARATDVFMDSDAKLSAVTDSYYYAKEASKPKYHEMTYPYGAAAAVGSHRYIVGGAPLQIVAERPEVVGIATSSCLCFSDTAANSTYDYKGQLSWSTTFRCKITIYDPRTGTESNPMGPYRFTTDTVPTTTAVVYGTIGCAYVVQVYLTTGRWHGNNRLRFYRYHDGDGTYYLEGDAAITYDATGLTTGGHVFVSGFTFAMSDDELALQPEIQYDNDPPPWHSASFVWNSRAWFVDALRPSRVYVSKEWQLGSVPPENVLWTDEGTGGDILGFLPGFNGLLLLRERSIWIVPYFQSAEAAYAQPLIPDVGCVSGRSAVFAEGVLWFAAPSGLHSFDGTTLTNHSERLGGLDRKVWDHAGELTTCYYNRNDWKVTFACDGSGLSIDIRNGAVSLCSAPEYCCANIATSAYSGPLYGGDGEIWKEESTANNSLTLDRNGSMATSSRDFGALITYPITDLTWTWNNGVTSGTAFLGWEGSVFSGGSALWLASAGLCGRALTLVDGDATDAFTVSLGHWTSPSSMLARTQQTQSAMSSILIDNTLCYYEGQDVFLSRHRQASIYERMDIFASDFVDASASIVGAFYALGSAGYAASSAFSSGSFENDSVYQVPIRLRGQQFYYYLRVAGKKTFPNIRSVGVHFRLCGPRSRA